MSLTRKLTATAAAVALVGSAGLGAAQAATQSSSGSSTTTSTAKQGKRGGPTSAQISSIASKLDVTSAQLKAAMKENRPAKPTGEKRGNGKVADIAEALGVDEAKVKEIFDANRPAKNATRPAKGQRPPKLDQSVLTTALATGLNLDETTVKAALTKLEAEHEAEHEARHAAMYAGIAKSLNLEASDVQAAFEAVLPKRS